MRRITTSLSVLLLAPIIVAHANAQDQKEVHQKPAHASTTTEKDAPKNEVELYLEEARKRGEPIYGVCLDQDCEESNANGLDFQLGKSIELPQPDYPAVAARARFRRGPGAGDTRRGR